MAAFNIRQHTRRVETRVRLMEVQRARLLTEVKELGSKINKDKLRVAMLKKVYEIAKARGVLSKLRSRRSWNAFWQKFVEETNFVLPVD